MNRPERTEKHDLDAYLPAIVAADQVSFARWVASAEPVVRVALRSFAAYVDTEAILQEALLRVWQVAPRFVPDGKPNSLVRLAVRIARNLAVSEKRQSRATCVDEQDAEGALAGEVDFQVRARADPMLRRVIGECRKALPQKPALALAARLESGGADPEEALAARIDMRKNTFLQNVTRARKLLMECLERHGIDLLAELA